MSRLKDTEFWAVVWPSGRVDIDTIGYTKKQTIENFERVVGEWRYWKRKYGVRAVRVRIEVLDQ